MDRAIRLTMGIVMGLLAISVALLAVPIVEAQVSGTRLQDMAPITAGSVADEDVQYLVDVTGTPGTPHKITVAELKTLYGTSPADIWVDESGDTMTGNLRVNAQVMIGSAADPEVSIILDLSAADKAIRVTRLTDPSTGIATPRNGMIAYDSTDNELQAYINGSWTVLISGLTDLYVDESGDTMTGQLVFSGVTNDITTATNEDLTLNPNGTGVVAIPPEGLMVGGAGSDLDASAVVELSSDVKALLLTRPSDVQTDIATPVNGMIAYDSTEDMLYGYINGVWTDLGATAGAGGDITSVFSTLSGAVTSPTIQTGQSLNRDVGGVNEAGSLTVDVYNDTGGTLYACTPIYYTGTDSGTGVPEVGIADNDDTSKMPAVGVLIDDITTGSSGKAVQVGELISVDTATAQSWSVGDVLYINNSGTSADSDCGNAMTNVKPTTTGEQPQPIAVVSVVDGTSGKLLLSGVDQLGSGEGGLPAGSGTETQYRLNASSLGAVDSSSYTAGTKTLTYGETVAFTGTIDLPSGTAPTTDAVGEIALDTSITDHQPLWQYYDGGENMTIIAIDTADLPATDDQIIKYDAATDKWGLEADAGGGGGVSGGGGIVYFIPESFTVYGSLAISSTLGVDQPAAISTNGGTLDYHVLAFSSGDTGIDSGAVREFNVPDDYVDTPSIDIYFMLLDENTGTVEWEADLLCVDDGEDLLGVKGSVTSPDVATESIPSTAGNMGVVSISLTDPGCSPGDIGFVLISTDADDPTNDTAAGVRYIKQVVFRYEDA